MWCKAPRQRWHLRRSWQRRICNLQNLQGPVGFESHPLRQPFSPINTVNSDVEPAQLAVHCTYIVPSYFHRHSGASRASSRHVGAGTGYVRMTDPDTILPALTRATACRADDHQPFADAAQPSKTCGAFADLTMVRRHDYSRRRCRMSVEMQNVRGE